MIPEDLRYTAEHEWIATAGETAGAAATVRVGITDFAQDALGDIVFVHLPEAGSTVTAGEPMGEVESTKSVSEIYAPIDGKIVGRNDALTTQPELINSDPYGAGWLVEIELGGDTSGGNLLDAAGYAKLIEEG